jgi:hypothetical protein
MPDTSPQFSQTNYFPYLISDINRELRIKLELGYFNISPVADSAQSAVIDKTINLFYPNAGGKQQESLINNETLNRYKSQSLSNVSNGVMPFHIDITGSPYCTFLEGTISNVPHPYYDLIQGPDSVKPQNSVIFNTVQPVQQTFTNQIKNQNIANSLEQVNAVGSIYLPPTTLTNSSIKNLGLQVSTTKNIWQIDNLSYNNGINSDFNFQDYLGWFPKSGTQLQNLQSYAQVWPLSDMSMIQVYSSSSQISLTRKYPLSQDIVFDQNTKYTVFNSGTNSTSNFGAHDLGFTNSDVPVGFTLKFNAVVSNTIPVPSGISTNAILTEPRMIISWGNLDFTLQDLKNEVASISNSQSVDQNPHKKISLYTLEISPNRPPKLYINYTKDSVLRDNLDANKLVIELPNLKSLNSPTKNSGAKASNDYNLFVFYSGQYLKIGNDPDPNTWSDIKNPNISLGTSGISFIYDHYLDNKSNINITAQFMNFMFAFGQPLFSPYDPVNTIYNSDPTKETSNTLNQISSNNIVYIGKNNTYSDIDTYIAATKNKIINGVFKNSANTFSAYSDGKYYGQPSCYFDARCGFSTIKIDGKFLVDMIYVPLTSESYQQGTSQAYLASTKMTLPRTLGGNIFNYHADDQPGETDIKESYVEYFNSFSLTEDISDYVNPPTVSQVLTDSLTSLNIEKDFGATNGNSVFVKSGATLNLINLNRNSFGKQLLHFIRNNVGVIKISAGYGNNLYTWFEGAITDITAKENLDSTVFELKCEDLLQHLFVNDKTCIVSRQRINFFGQKYYDIINYLCEHTELKNHFRYELGSTNSYSLYTQLKYDGQPPYKNLFRLPALSGNAQKTNLNRLSVSSYVSSGENGNDTTYFGVLKQIASLMITDLSQLTSSSATTSGATQQADNLVDQPIFYWYSGTTGISSTPIDGIVFTSRNGKNDLGQEKDEQPIYIRKSSLLTDETYNITEIDYLHGVIALKDPVYTSSTNTNNLQSLGLYRGFDNGGNAFSIAYPVPNSMNYPPDLAASSGYVGYNRTLIFDDPKSLDSTSNTLPQSIMGDRVQARNFIINIMNAFYDTVLESISTQVYVTQPLKDYGHFRVYFEDESSPVIQDKFFFTRVNYEFDINSNLIRAAINGNKKPLFT